MSLLPLGDWCAGFGNGSHKRFVVSKNGERMTFKKELEVQAHDQRWNNRFL